MFKMKKLAILFLWVFLSFSMKAQTAGELKKIQSSKKKEIAKLEKEVKTLQKKINALPGWRKGAFGTFGVSLSRYNNWFSRTTPNAAVGNIGITANGFSNLIENKFFWRNALSINLGWVALDDETTSGDEGFETATDACTISSLYGKRLTKKWALSALVEYKTTLIDNFNDPGFLDLGIGFTWTPVKKLVLVMQPGNYNFIFSTGESVFNSSLGAKVVADYHGIYHKIKVKSNLSIFQSYKDESFSNWVWVSSSAYTFWRGMGLGFELSVRSNKQETLNNALISDATAKFSSIENKIQSYWLFGVSYVF